MEVNVLKVLDVFATHLKEIARQLLVYLTFSKSIYGDVVIEALPTKELLIESIEPKSKLEDNRHSWEVYAYPRLFRGKVVYSYSIRVNFTHEFKDKIVGFREISLNRTDKRFSIEFSIRSDHVTDYDFVLGPMSLKKYEFEVLKGSADVKEHYDKYTKRCFTLLVVKSKSGRVQGSLKFEVERGWRLIPTQLHSDCLPENLIPFRITLKSRERLEKFLVNRLIMRLPDVILA